MFCSLIFLWLLNTRLSKLICWHLSHCSSWILVSNSFSRIQSWVLELLFSRFSPFRFCCVTTVSVQLLNSLTAMGDGTSMILGTGMRPCMDEEMQKGMDCSALDLMISQKFLINFYKIRIFSQNFYIRFDAKKSRIEASETCFNVSNQCTSLLRCSFIGQVEFWSSHSLLTAPNPPGAFDNSSLDKTDRIGILDSSWIGTQASKSFSTSVPSRCAMIQIVIRRKVCFRMLPFWVFWCQASTGLLKKNTKTSPCAPSSMSGTGGAWIQRNAQLAIYIVSISLYFIVLFRNISFHLQAVSSRASSNDAHRRKYRWPQSVAGETCEMGPVIYSSKKCRNAMESLNLSTSATARIHAETSKSQTVHDSCINFTRKFGRKETNSKVEEHATLWEPQGIGGCVVSKSLLEAPRFACD